MVVEVNCSLALLFSVATNVPFITPSDDESAGGSSCVFKGRTFVTSGEEPCAAASSLNNAGMCTLRSLGGLRSLGSSGSI